MCKYVLSSHSSMRKLKIKVDNKKYFIYADTPNEAFITPNNDFKLKEKLYILNYPLEVVWAPIWDVEYDFLRILYSFIKPKHLVIKTINGKVVVSVDRSL